VRIAISASLPALLLLILLRGKGAADVNVFYEWAIILAGWFVVALGFVWAKRTGLTMHQSVRMLLGPTLASPGWKDPALMRLLSPASGKVRAPVGDQPSDYLRAIRELAPHVENPGLHVTAAAESVLKAIDKCDSELAELARDAGPDEANRLSTQLEALESGGAGDTQERNELRDLVRHQLDLVRRMQGRREIVQRQRSHFVDLLKALWGAIREAGESRDGGPDGVQRIDALCGEIRRDLERSIPVS
jgi:hypothetical protein